VDWTVKSIAVEYAAWAAGNVTGIELVATKRAALLARVEIDSEPVEEDVDVEEIDDLLDMPELELEVAEEDAKVDANVDEMVDDE
jgi:hypothetical protein